MALMFDCVKTLKDEVEERNSVSSLCGLGPAKSKTDRLRMKTKMARLPNTSRWTSSKTRCSVYQLTATNVSTSKIERSRGQLSVISTGA